MDIFDAQAFLDSAGVAREIVAYRRAETIFSQGDPGDSVFYIQKGGVKLSAVSKAGREAVIAMLGPGDFVGEGHFMRILSDTAPAADADTRRVILCSGKVAYDLIEARDAAGIKDVQIIRLEQLYPFPGEPLTLRLSRMEKLEEVVWCQEEPKNNGAWFFVEPLIEEALAAAKSRVRRARYAGRNASASPATGLASRHASEQGALVADALGLSVRSEIRRRKQA